jgi:hypothetical protein
MFHATAALTTGLETEYRCDKSLLLLLKDPGSQLVTLMSYLIGLHI